MPRVPNKKKLYSQCATSSEKGDATCHISKNAQSAGLGGILKQKNFRRMKFDKNFLQGKTKSDLYYRG